MSKSRMRGHFRYLRFKTFPMKPRTPQCKVFFPLLSSSKHSGVPKDSKSPTFPSVGLHPHTWPKWGCDTLWRCAFEALWCVVTCVHLIFSPTFCDVLVCVFFNCLLLKHCSTKKIVVFYEDLWKHLFWKS